MIKISKEMLIGDIMDQSPDMGPVLTAMGMHCLNCPSSRMESVEEAAIVHGFEPDDLVASVNDLVAKKEMLAKMMEQ